MTTTTTTTTPDTCGCVSCGIRLRVAADLPLPPGAPAAVADVAVTGHLSEGGAEMTWATPGGAVARVRRTGRTLRVAGPVGALSARGPVWPMVVSDPPGAGAEALLYLAPGDVVDVSACAAWDGLVVTVEVWRPGPRRSWCVGGDG